jgi:hypothetical protein
MSVRPASGTVLPCLSSGLPWEVLYRIFPGPAREFRFVLRSRHVTLSCAINAEPA